MGAPVFAAWRESRRRALRNPPRAGRAAGKRIRAIYVHAGPARPRGFAGRSGLALRPVGERAPRLRERAGGGVKRSLRERPPARGWRRFADAFGWLAPDFFAPHPELSGGGRFAYAFAGSVTFFGMLALFILVRIPQELGLSWFGGAGPGGESPFTTPENVFVIVSFLLTLFFAFICSRNERSHSPVRVYLFAYLLPLIVWILASQIGISGLLVPLSDNGGGS